MELGEVVDTEVEVVAPDMDKSNSGNRYTDCNKSCHQFHNEELGNKSAVCRLVLVANNREVELVVADIQSEDVDKLVDDLAMAVAEREDVALESEVADLALELAGAESASVLVDAVLAQEMEVLALVMGLDAEPVALVTVLEMGAALVEELVLVPEMEMVAALVPVVTVTARSAEVSLVAPAADLDLGSVSTAMAMGRTADAAHRLEALPERGLELL